MISRSLLIAIGVIAAAAALIAFVVLPAARRAMAAMMVGTIHFSKKKLNPFKWIEILPDNRIRLMVTKAEMGQGIHTGLAQLVAEELEIPIDLIEVTHVSTRQGEDLFRLTVGSMSIASLYKPLRHAAAAVREMLRAEASLKLGVPPEQLTACNGSFMVKDNPDKSITYSELSKGNIKRHMPKKPVTLKTPGQFAIIGQPASRVENRAKVTGEAIFGQDIRIEGMLYGALARPPVIGAAMLEAKPGKAAEMPGVVKVVIEKGFAGVVATTRSGAKSARDALEVTWDTGKIWQQQDLERLVSAGGPGGVVVQKSGNSGYMVNGGIILSAQYRSGLVAHASLETQAALAVVDGSGAKVWTPTQSETVSAFLVSRALGIKMKNVEIIPTLLGGGFGRKAGSGNVSSAAAEAACLARAACAPVHVGWDRDEEFRDGYFRPMTHHELSAVLNDGRIEIIEWQQASGDSFFGLIPNSLARIVGFDPGATRGAWIFYNISNKRVKVWRRRMPVPTGQMRGLGLVPNLFPLECFMDEAAYAAGKDPLQFRLEHLGDEADDLRLADVLTAAAERADWGAQAPSGRGLGIACCVYDGSVVAEIAEISLDRKTGMICLHRVVAAIECGLAVNPEQIRNQVEGSIIMGASNAINEEITIKDGRVTTASLSEYPIFTIADTPEIETIILNRLDIDPAGCGEAPIGPIAPAIANAFFNLTGKRLREMPMTPRRVLAALRG